VDRPRWLESSARADEHAQHDQAGERREGAAGDPVDVDGRAPATSPSRITNAPAGRA
jgi:hypothetical protein